MTKRILASLLILILLLFSTSCKELPKIKNEATASKYMELEAVTEKLKGTVYGEYQYTYALKEFGDRTVLQLDKRNVAADILIPYCLIFPKNYDPDTKYPVLTYLHGAGETGNDNNSHLSLMVRYCRSYPQFLDDSFIVCPQCPDGDWWNATGVTNRYTSKSLDVVMSILDDLAKHCSVDTDRYYVTGVSMGGFGTFNIISAYPNKFAAAVPICGGGNPEYADRLVDIPLWLFHSRDDNIVSFEGSNSMYKAIKAAGGQKINFTVLDGMGHNAWNATEHNDELFRWIYYQSKSGKKTLDYTHMLELRDSKDKTLFNENDFALSVCGEGKITLYLNEIGAEKYKNFTADNIGETVTVYYEGKSIGTFKIAKKVTDGVIVFKTTLSSTEAVAFCGKI